jgi:UDP-N-acetyl-D-glucosamine dehydrogenase
MTTLPPPAAELASAIAGRSARVGILGLGYVGLPLADALVAAGFPVLGLDIDADKVGRLRHGKSYIGHFPADRVESMLSTGRFEPTIDFDRVAEADALVLCLPTPLTEPRDPDLSHVTSAAEAIARRLRRGQLVVLESTTYPGTTRDVIRPILEATGMRVGRDIFLAYSPERQDPGNRQHTVATIPKVVGGLDPVSGLLAVELYTTIVQRVVPVSSAEVAEACKILENTYRAVNIALVNELKVLYDKMGIDIWEVIEAAKTKPFGFEAFSPGPGWGGHCIPIDPFYLAWVARKHDCFARFIELAGEVNTAMPAFVVGKLADALNERGKPIKGSRVCLLGIAYKKDVDDPRESPGLELLDVLREKGAEVSYNDPHIPRLAGTRHHGSQLVSQTLTEAFLRQQDCVLIVTDHSAYDWEWIVAHAPLVVDTRNATRCVRQHRQRIVRA